jgi:hypothetical protein
VYDVDRSDLNSTILKEVVGVFSARRGHRLLLKSDSRNPDNQNLKIYDLEPQSRFPGKMQEWLGVNGDILEPGPRSNLEGRELEEFNIIGVTDVWQNIRIVGDLVQMPKLHAECMVRLEPRDGEIDADWYRLSHLNAEFTADIVRPAVHNHRLKTGQHVPIAPVTPRRRQPRPYATRPLSE